MEKQEFYKFIGRLVVFIHGLFVLLYSKDIINLVIGAIGSLLIFLLVTKIIILLNFCDFLLQNFALKYIITMSMN